MKLLLYTIFEKRRFSLIFVFCIFCCVACSKLVQVSPPVTSVTGASVYNTDATAASVMTGLYTRITPLNSGGASLPQISIWAGLSADEFTLWSGITSGIPYSYYTNNLSINTAGSDLWIFIYPNIFTCNSVIESLRTATSLTPAVRQQLLGEAMFMRALFYFYLTSLYGDVPLALSTNYTQNASLGRTSKALVYQQIIADLHDAQSLLSPNYLSANLQTLTTEKLRPTKWAATALLARAYLYSGNWGGADSAASVLLENGSYKLSSLTGSTRVFTKNSSEAIWQLQPINTGWNTELARLFIIPSTGPSSTYYLSLSRSLLNSFEVGDARRLSWVDSVVAGGVTYYFPYKYQSATLNANVTEYYMVLRLAEQYLIRAEARVEENNFGGAVADLDSIRSRAQLPGYGGAMNAASILSAIGHERQIELFSEWGDRWLNLKRTGAIDTAMALACPTKNTAWNTSQQLYPIPLSDLQTDVHLSQNPGY